MWCESNFGDLKNMVSLKQLKEVLMATNEVAYVEAQGDGYHYHLTVVSDVFCDKTKVARQKWVYSHLKDYITTGSLHALNMNTWTTAEWEKQRG